jgi:hypothetical protein
MVTASLPAGAMSYTNSIVTLNSGNILLWIMGYVLRLLQAQEQPMTAPSQLTVTRWAAVLGIDSCPRRERGEGRRERGEGRGERGLRWCSGACACAGAGACAGGCACARRCRGWAMRRNARGGSSRRWRGLARPTRGVLALPARPARARSRARARGGRAGAVGSWGLALSGGGAGTGAGAQTLGAVRVRGSGRGREVGAQGWAHAWSDRLA